MNNINWAPIVGAGLLIVSLAGMVLNIIPSSTGLSILAVGLGVLGIHGSVTSLGRKLGAK